MSPDTIAEHRTCANCRDQFPIRERDLDFYRRIDVPLPSWCPPCRNIRRHGHINDYVYYARSCDDCGKGFVAMFPEQSDYRVICQKCWYAETRDNFAEGGSYDFSRPFFEQFDELMHDAPQMGNLAINVENCDYCESLADCKNCYLISECSNCEDCQFSYWIQKTTDCIDTCYLHECEQCYELSDSFSCYRTHYSSNCTNCSDSVFLDSCIGCSNCAFCVNLRHKQYHILNRPYSKEEYFEELKKFNLNSRSAVKQQRSEFLAYVKQQPRKHLLIEQAEDSLGDYVRNTRNCYEVFHCYDAEDCSYGEHVWRGAKDCMDVQTAGRDAELLYETTNTALGSYQTHFARYCWGCRFTEYSNMCVNGSYLFGCVSLNAGAKYCILNKQYSEEEYFALVKRITQQMRESGEYGEFFPLSISLFGYNNSVSYDTHRYTKKEVLERGWKWEEAQSGAVGKETIAPENVPDDINSVCPSICQETLRCDSCSKNYRIGKKELLFYQSEAIPLPDHCPDCRHRERLARRNQKLFRTTSCKDCGTALTTTLNPDEYTHIVCERCYLQHVY